MKVAYQVLIKVRLVVSSQLGVSVLAFDFCLQTQTKYDLRLQGSYQFASTVSDEKTKMRFSVGYSDSCFDDTRFEAVI